ncbi:hypothetical protein JHK87_055102 [Glycine soja]|nr:hypothetical protein JHK87_055102 [Glycine soja]
MENVNISRTNIMKAKSGSTTNEVENGYTDMTEYRQAIVRLLISESVAEGHVMVAKSLRLYLRASLHSSALSDESSYKAEEEATNQSQNPRGLQSLVRLWYITQLKAITSISGMEVSSFIIGNKTLIHFEVSCYKLGNNGKVQLAYNSSENSGKAAEMLFLLTFGEEYLHHGKLNAYESRDTKGKRATLA